MSGKKFRVLLAESGSGETEESLRALYPEPESQLELSVVSSIPTLLGTIDLAAPETIFLDLSLGGPDPLDVVRRLHRAAPGIPLIAFADVADKPYASRCISEGAIDYLLKGFMDTRTMERALRTALERNTREGLDDFLRDPLTGLHNREGFTTLGNRSTETALRSGGKLVLLCARIENVATWRPEFGSAVSEQAIRGTSELISSCFRCSDIIARVGEAQFAALAIDAAEPSAHILRQRVQSRLAIYNQGRKPWGTILLHLSAGYWSAHDTRPFAEFLDDLESELRDDKPALSQSQARQEPSPKRG
ncbi:MAG TPA: diguanylate cyclase [Candidatus Acidoferrum sp.]|nr:diguanylate cyclase [Candidatus Acidoferrum sp.]